MKLKMIKSLLMMDDEEKLKIVIYYLGDLGYFLRILKILFIVVKKIWFILVFVLNWN